MTKQTLEQQVEQLKYDLTINQEERIRLEEWLAEIIDSCEHDMKLEGTLLDKERDFTWHFYVCSKCGHEENKRVRV